VVPGRLTAMAPILAAVLIGFVLLHEGDGNPSARTGSATPARIVATAKTRAPAALAGSARRFLRAFLAYEVGDRRPQIVDALAATATTSFARELAGASPTGATPTPAPAKLGALTLDPLGGDPPLALVTAGAHRPSGPEQLSFLFTERPGRWLASAPGE
jgi:hypothetical protein